MYVSAGSIVGIALGIICVLFLIQRFGTRVVGSVFSPVILLWLLFNAMIGIYNMHTYGAGVFRAFGPNYWFAYLLRNGYQGWKSLGGVVLCITGTAAQQVLLQCVYNMHSLAALVFVLVWSPQRFCHDHVVTAAGAEALFADLGHFSMRSIQVNQGCGTCAVVVVTEAHHSS